LLREKALQFRRQGYNCSQCIVKAAGNIYGIPAPEQVLSACQGINAGLGIGYMCDILLAGVMVFGLLFDETSTKRLRIRLLSRFSEKHPQMDCCVLIKLRKDDTRCEGLIGETADLIEEIIAEEYRRRC